MNEKLTCHLCAVRRLTRFKNVYHGPSLRVVPSLEHGGEVCEIVSTGGEGEEPA